MTTDVTDVAHAWDDALARLARLARKDREAILLASGALLASGERAG